MTDQPLILHSPRKEPAAYKLPWCRRYSETVADRICEEVINGRVLNRICIEEPWAPHSLTVHMWLKEHPEFREAYDIARRIRADQAAQEIINLADTAIDGVNTESIKIQIHARQWLAGKMNPRDYGDRKIVDANIHAQVTTTNQIDVSHLTIDEIHAAERALMKTIEGTYAEEEDNE